MLQMRCMNIPQILRSLIFILPEFIRPNNKIPTKKQLIYN